LKQSKNKVVGIIPVHIGGNMVDMDEIKNLQKSITSGLLRILPIVFLQRGEKMRIQSGDGAVKGIQMFRVFFLCQ